MVIVIFLNTYPMWFVEICGFWMQKIQIKTRLKSFHFDSHTSRSHHVVDEHITTSVLVSMTEAASLMHEMSYIASSVRHSFYASTVQGRIRGVIL